MVNEFIVSPVLEVGGCLGKEGQHPRLILTRKGLKTPLTLT